MYMRGDAPYELFIGGITTHIISDILSCNIEIYNVHKGLYMTVYNRKPSQKKYKNSCPPPLPPMSILGYSKHTVRRRNVQNFLDKQIS